MTMLVRRCGFQIFTNIRKNLCTRLLLSMSLRDGIFNALSLLAIRVTRYVIILAFTSMEPLLTESQLHPLTGQGGNSAIETSAALANHLVTALNKNHFKPLSTEHLSSVFEKTQRQRYDRVTNLVESAHIAQRFGSLDTPVMKFAVRYFVPYMPTSLVANSWIDSYCPAVSLNMLPLPNLPRRVPFHDDPPQAQRQSGSTELAIFTGSISIGSIIFLLFALGYLFDLLLLCMQPQEFFL